ncbi:MAG: hypothetical protein UU34_C0028G0004 [Candidatus Curtissbacteria bacterium GW2011_GWA1_41_11]|uniref:Uncharacterized protein n=1 Tax=Candidatus Curtissbacteria bacterium GW2011_GWA1_41_11 TaxID=1618409 RepID=A0A0G0WN57_9BACT|nr:MAG: hypothetical protein UU34_C0028G0004 [Candidatus Curtissbacteria bacterium GW2011_GWA1_41_11]
MSSEQETRKELPSEFPKIPKRLVERFIREDWEPLLEGQLDDLMAKEPFLWVYFDQASKRPNRGKDVIVGALIVHSLFNELEKEGIVLSPVSPDTIQAYVYGGIDARKYALADKSLSFEEREERKRQTDFNFPIPFSYCEENPALMTYIAQLGPGELTEGMITYHELKRWQFHAAQLAKQLGGN